MPSIIISSFNIVFNNDFYMALHHVIYPYETSLHHNIIVLQCTQGAYDFLIASYIIKY